MLTVKDIQKKAIEICGSEKLADEMLESINANTSEDYMKKQINIKYRSMCIDEISDGQAVNIKQIADNVYEIKDYIDSTHYLCMIQDDGTITFFEKSSEFDNLAEYVAQYEDEDEENE